MNVKSAGRSPRLTFATLCCHSGTELAQSFWGRRKLTTCRTSHGMDNYLREHICTHIFCRVQDNRATLAQSLNQLGTVFKSYCFLSTANRDFRLLYLLSELSDCQFLLY